MTVWEKELRGCEKWSSGLEQSLLFWGKVCDPHLSFSSLPLKLTPGWSLNLSWHNYIRKVLLLYERLQTSWLPCKNASVLEVSLLRLQGSAVYYCERRAAVCSFPGLWTDLPEKPAPHSQGSIQVWARWDRERKAAMSKCNGMESGCGRPPRFQGVPRDADCQEGLSVTSSWPSRTKLWLLGPRDAVGFWQASTVPRGQRETSPLSMIACGRQAAVTLSRTAKGQFRFWLFDFLMWARAW